MTGIPEIACVNIKDALAMTEDGQALPITNAFDDEGDDCDLADAVVCVAGPDADGKWLTIDFRQMEAVAVQ